MASRPVTWRFTTTEHARPDPIDDEGLPVPPPAHGRAAQWLLRLLVSGEKATFVAIAIALLGVAIAVFVRLTVGGSCRWPGTGFR